MRENELQFRFAKPADTPLILRFIRELAAWEELENEVVATEPLLEKWIFQERKAEVLFAMTEGREIGFALFFHNFSTFLGRAGLYLEDLYVLPAFRGRGYGRAIFRALAGIAAERGCGRLEWWCLDRNVSAVGFYRALGAEAMEDWTVFRLSGETLRTLDAPSGGENGDA